LKLREVPEYAERKQIRKINRTWLAKYKENVINEKEKGKRNLDNS